MTNKWVAAVMGCVLMASCGGNRTQTEAELSEFGAYVDSLDTALQGEWFTRMGVSDDADEMLAYLREALPKNGLDTAAFFVAEIAEDLHTIHTLAFDSVGISINDVLRRLDGNLQKVYVDYTTGQRYGFMRPDKVLNRMDYKVGGTDYAQLFDYEIKTPDYEEAKKQMASDKRMDYLRTSEPNNRTYQALQKKLVSTTDTAERRKIAINMERCRWQIKQPETSGRQIIVNIAAQQLWAVGGDSALSMKICCGAVPTKTPLLCSAISYMQVNPEWVIPYNIIKTDVARHGGDSAYFARNDYWILDRKTNDTLRAKEVSPEKLKSGTVRVVQKGGRGNSLGRIVFRFPNNFSVYLHDTNNRGAFQRERRTLSHGCVRVEKPFELACFLLPEADEWTIDKIRLSMDIKPETERGEKYLKEHPDAPQPLKLMTYMDVDPKVPLFIVYYTAYPNPETGVVELWPDIYKYDAVIAKEMGSFLLK